MGSQLSELKSKQTTNGTHDIGWGSYWQNTNKSGALTSPVSAFISDTWQDFLKDFFDHKKPIKMLDIGCGNGFLTRLAIEVTKSMKGMSPVFFGADISREAIQALKSQYPQVHGVVSDIAQLPFPSQTFELIVGHFAVEYAGVNAFKEAARLLSTNGQLMFVSHIKESVINEESQQVLKIIKRFKQTKLLSRARQVFVAGYAIVSGTGTQADFFAADRHLAQAVEEVKPLLVEAQKVSIGTNLKTIYRDIAIMYQQIEAYDSVDVLCWFDKIEAEIEAYTLRMQTVLNVALDKKTIATIDHIFEKEGLRMVRKKVIIAPFKKQKIGFLFQYQRIE